MLTKDQVLEAVKGGRTSQAIDGRDYARLCDFFPQDDWPALGYQLAPGAAPPPVKEWTRENVIGCLRGDLAFAFEKALNKRGISASLMYSVVKMWLWVLGDELQHDERYAQYGLPLLKAVAVKYGLENPIGDDAGDEHKYSAEADY